MAILLLIFMLLVVGFGIPDSNAGFHISWLTWNVTLILKSSRNLSFSLMHYVYNRLFSCFFFFCILFKKSFAYSLSVEFLSGFSFTYYFNTYFVQVWVKWFESSIAVYYISLINVFNFYTIFTWFWLFCLWLFKFWLVLSVQFYSSPGMYTWYITV